MSDSVPLRCKCRHQAVTSLRCARCSIPICPDCSRVAPAGMLCRTCVRGGKSHLYEYSAGGMVRAVVFALPVSLFGGWLLATPVLYGMGYFILLFGLIHGMAVGEAALRGSGHKRGLPMEILAGATAVLGIVVGWFIVYALQRPQNVPNSEEIAEAMYRFAHLSPPPFARLTDPWMLLLLVVVAVCAAGRIRTL